MNLRLYWKQKYFQLLELTKDMVQQELRDLVETGKLAVETICPVRYKQSEPENNELGGRLLNSNYHFRMPNQH